MKNQDVLSFWAKKSEENNQHYPLLYHMLDTTAVCREIWEKCLHHDARQFIANTPQLTEPDASRWVSFWVGLHDIGKASPDFQGNSESVKQELIEAGFTFNRRPETYHGAATACILQAFFQNSLSPELAKKISVTVGGHHGVFHQTEELKRTRLYLGEGLWNDARTELYKHMIDLCDMRNAPPPKGSPGNAFFMILAGLTSVADWIASNEKCFPYNVEHRMEDHLSYAHNQARQALDILGWAGWQPSETLADITTLFPFITAANIRPLQTEAVSLAQTLKDRPALVIIEAPMGEGKTEAAIYMADSWLTTLGQRGYYFALPTMATSDQMFGRVGKYLNNRYKSERVNFMLLHGHAALSAEFETLKDKFETRNLDVDSKGTVYDDASASVVASEWFTHRKRGLLAPFGVGTIDQALLAVLQTRHVFVRLFGLGHKTVIIDEVHAYDAYMSTLLERLLEWLAALGSSVVLLSATLPKGRKDALLRAYQIGLTGQSTNIAEEVSKAKYPRISWSIGREFKAKTIETSPESNKALRLQWVNGKLPEAGTEYELGNKLQEALKDGGCAAVICNTVDRAQEVYQMLKSFFTKKDAVDGFSELDLLHARYLYGDRQEREKRTLKRFGKDGAHRPKRAVLVATQIIEQSLDLDFDLMVTEMAPVDLLLQRVGRLHRHKENQRPEELKSPMLWIYEPEMKGEAPCFGGGTEAVYDYHILLRSWLAINSYVGKKPVRIPEDIEELIEEVYDKRECPAELSEEVKKKWEESKRKLEADIEYEQSEAGTRWIKRPLFSGQLVDITSEPREEDDPSIHQAHQALTRLTGLTVNVLCLFGNDVQPYLDFTRSRLLDNKVRPDKELVKELLMHSVIVSRQGISEKIIEGDQKVPQAWREEPLLRHHYILFFDNENQCNFDKHVISLDNERGLIIKKMS